MLQSFSVATDEWTQQRSTAIVDRFNQSVASTEPSEYTSGKWGFRWEGHRHRPLEGNQAQQEQNLTLTDLKFSVRISEKAKLFAELKAKQALAHSLALEMKRRVSFLKAEARSEGDPFNSVSEQYFWQLMDARPFLKKPRIFLLENGDLRAVWKGEGGKHIGLQFLGDGDVQYVIFATRPGERVPSRVYGTDTFRGILRQIAALEIEDLISA